MAEMRAVRFHQYGPASVLTLESVDRPEPGDGEVVVRVCAAGVNPIDWKFRAGYLQEFMPLDLPSTPGIDLAGTVESVGADVGGFATGDAVFGRGSGTYAEFALAPSGSLAVKPERISFDEAATLGVGGVTAWVGRITGMRWRPPWSLRMTCMDLPGFRLNLPSIPNRCLVALSG